MTALIDLKNAHRAVWAAGDYAAVAEHIEAIPPLDLLDRLDVQPGQDVLDVATGTGNVALRAAARGARVVGLDLVPELLRTARQRAEGFGVVVEWTEGDAEALPYEDETFDHVVSVFGVQFAPRHEVAAAELVRACRPGGRIGLVNWTPDGLIGELFTILSGYLPAPPAYASAPPLWGDEAHVAALFAGTGVEPTFARGHNPWRFDSAEQWVRFLETMYGPVVKARERLSADWCWDSCREEILAMSERRNAATDGSLLLWADYLVTIGRKVG